MVNELFPPSLPAASAERGLVLDVLVARLSQEMIDDYPASDPRWAESLPPGLCPLSFFMLTFCKATEYGAAKGKGSCIDLFHVAYIATAC